MRAYGAACRNARQAVSASSAREESAMRTVTRTSADTVHEVRYVGNRRDDLLVGEPARDTKQRCGNVRVYRSIVDGRPVREQLGGRVIDFCIVCPQSGRGERVRLRPLVLGHELRADR